jgi:Ca-activated chloride channel family protein
MRRRAILLGPVLLLLAGCDGGELWSDLWWTGDQQGARAFAAGDYGAASARFEDRMRRGIALYYSQQFDAAIAEWAELPTAEAWFCRGNALAHLERYEEATAAYRRALELRPDYPEAEHNVEYLRPFLPIKTPGGTTGMIGRDAAADEVVFDADAKKLEEEGRDTEMEQQGLLSEEEVERMWLQQVDVSPASFLRQKFRFQAAAAEKENEPAGEERP